MAFEHIWISGMVMDEKGETMSKSKGNVIYPEPVVKKYGADALRLAGAIDAKLGSDIRFSDKKVSSASKFIQKLWSVSRFVSIFPKVEEKPPLLPADKWIIAELNKTIDEVRRHYDELDFFGAKFAVNFTWDVFADHYVEMVKNRAFNGDENGKKAAWWTLYYVLDNILRLLAPVIPFVTDYIYRELFGKTVHLQSFPEIRDYDKSLLNLTPIIREVNSAIWKTKKEKGLSLKSQVKELYLPESLKDFELDLKNMHHVENIYFGEAKGEVILTDSGLKIGFKF
jgi:valyl-tRNA synthetase